MKIAFLLIVSFLLVSCNYDESHAGLCETIPIMDIGEYAEFKYTHKIGNISSEEAIQIENRSDGVYYTSSKDNETVFLSFNDICFYPENYSIDQVLLLSEYLVTPNRHSLELPDHSKCYTEELAVSAGNYIVNSCPISFNQYNGKISLLNETENAPIYGWIYYRINGSDSFVELELINWNGI